MIEVTSPTFLDALFSFSQQPRFLVQHERGKAQMTWNPRNSSVGGVTIHAVRQEGAMLVGLWYNPTTELWYVGKQTQTLASASPFIGSGTVSIGLADPSGTPGGLAGFTTRYHRIQAFPDGPLDTAPVTQIIFSHADGTLTLATDEDGSLGVVSTMPASSLVASATSISVSHDLNTPRVYVANNDKGRIEVIPWTTGAPTGSVWDYGSHWTIYELAPYAVRDTMGRDTLYFTGATRTGLGRTLYRTTYDPVLDVWTEPEQVFIFDTSNPANGISHPCVSALPNGWYALTYIKQTGDSDAVVAARYRAVRLAPYLGTTWGPERMIASMNTVAGVTGRTVIEPDQPLSIFLDNLTRVMQGWVREGYYATPINATWGLAPSGTDITDRISTFNATASSGITSGKLNFTHEAPLLTDPSFAHHDIVHVKYGLVTEAGVEYVPIMSAMVDSYDYDERTGVADVECRELSARLIVSGEQDDATTWTGANHYAFVPTAENYQELVLPTQLNKSLAVDTAIDLSDGFRPADATRAATAVYTVTITPYDECTTADAARYRIAAPFTPATDVVVEGIFELVSQSSSIDPSPGVYCGADADGTVYYSLEYRVKKRQVIFAVQRMSLVGVAVRSETVVATIAPGGSTGVYTRIGVRLHRHGDRITASYMTQNGVAGTPLWRDHVYTYTDTVDPAAYTLTPMSLSVPGYCGIVAFSDALGLDATTSVAIYLATWRAFGVRPPLTYHHVLRDALALGGFRSHMEGFGFLNGETPTLGLASSTTTSFPTVSSWGVTATDAVYDGTGYQDSSALLIEPDHPTDAVATVQLTTETAWVALHARITGSEAVSTVYAPLPLGLVGERIGIALTSRTGPLADLLDLAPTGAPVIWVFRTSAASVVTTVAVMDAPPWAAELVASSGRLKPARFTLACQDTLLAVWVNDLYLGGVDLEGIALPFPAVRTGRFILAHGADPTIVRQHATELWMSAIPNTVAQVTINTRDSLSEWIGRLLDTAIVDCAFRGDGTFRLTRPDLPRPVDLLVLDRVTEARAKLNTYQVLTHARYIGKDGIYGDAYDIPLSIALDNRFRAFEDQTLVTVEQCREAARKKLIAVNRTEVEMDGVIVFDPRMERLDIIRILIGTLAEEICYVTDFSLTGDLTDVVTISPGLRRVGVS